MIALIDADIVTFRAAASSENEGEAWIPCSRANTIIETIMEQTGADEYEVWLSGKNNFRYSAYPEYKANRIGAYRPKWEMEVKDYLTSQWHAKWSDGCEADDMLGVRQCELKDSVICTIDKDLNMIPGKHYNFVKGIHYDVTDAEAIRFFYYQMLIGDTTDGIKGVPGIGPKKAEKLLLECTTEQEYFERVRDQYSSDEEMELNGKCLWIWRKLNDIWKMPVFNAPEQCEE
jgi:5'-3' exonuclease